MNGGLYSRYLNPKPIHVVTDLRLPYLKYKSFANLEPLTAPLLKLFKISESESNVFIEQNDCSCGPCF